MEFLHGVFLYEIAKYCQLESIALVEMFSSTIQKKLKKNSSAFSYSLRKKNLTQFQLDYDQCKSILFLYCSDTQTYAIESKRFPGKFFEPYQQSGQWIIRLRIPHDIYKKSNDWGWFRAVKFGNDTYALESTRYDGFFFEAFGLDGNKAKLKLTKARRGYITKIGRNPQNLFRITQIADKDNVVAIESKMYPGYCLDVHETNKSSDNWLRPDSIEIRLWNVGRYQAGRNNWEDLRWFIMKQVSGESLVSS